jgi:predicted  nucleic acid-binding Zn-ribbon protein
MRQISVKLDESTIDSLDREADEQNTSRANLVRELIQTRNDSGELEEQLQDITETLQDTRDELEAQQREYERQLADAQQENERLQRERRQILEQREQNRELVAFADQQQSILERQEARRARPVWSRAFRWVIGERTDHQQR